MSFDANGRSTAMRPRVLYFGAFAWMSIAAGRFIAPFLEHEANLNETTIGVTIGITLGLSAVGSALGGSVADFLEHRHPDIGRTTVLLLGATIGTIIFYLHGLWRLLPQIPFLQSPEWHITLRFLFALVSGPLVPVLDGICLAHLEKEPGSEKADYGKERLFGAISWGIACLIIGPFLDMFSYPAMYAFTTLWLFVLLIGGVIYVNGQKKMTAAVVQSQEQIPPDSEEGNAEGEVRNLKNQSSSDVSEESEHRHLSSLTVLQILLGSVLSTAFFFSYFCNSAGLTVVENLVFLFFEFLGSSNTLNGITVVLTVLFEVPIFHIAPLLLRRLSPSTLLQIGNIAFIIRVIGYTLVPKGHVWLVLLLEPLHGVIYGCSQTGAVEFVSTLMPIGYEASGQGMLYFFRNVGGIVGNSMGGFITEALGEREMYRTFAGIVAVGAVVLFFTVISVRNRPITRRSVSERGELEPLVLALSQEQDDENTGSNGHLDPNRDANYGTA